MKIAIFTESLPPQTDGVSHTMSHLAESLENMKFDFQFYSPFKPDKSVLWSHKVREIKSVPFPLYKDYRVGLPIFENLYVELDKFNPDIIHVASPTPLGIFGIDYAQKYSLPVVSSYHTHFVSYFSYYGFRLAENLGWTYLRWFHNRCNATFAPSESVVTELQEKGFHDVKLWQRGVNLESFSPEYRDDQLRASIGSSDIPVLLFVGRLVKEKDLDDLVEAQNILREWGHKFELVIVGDGPMKEELMNKLPNAHYPGYQFGKELARWYASADIFTFPSTTETFGNVIIEAFASGISAVGVRKGGVSDLISDGYNGYLASPNNPLDFAKKVQILLKNKDLRKTMGKNGITSAGQKCWEAINKKLIENYYSILFRFYSAN